MSVRSASLTLLLSIALAAPGLSVDHRVDTASVSRGSVTIAGIHGRGIGVGIDTVPVDGRIDDVVLLQAFGRIPDELPLLITNARIVLRRDSVTVTDLDGSSLRVTLSLATAGRSAAESDREGYFYSGFGISRMLDDWGDFQSIRSFLDDPESGTLTRANVCESGGTHATSCSIECLGRYNIPLGCSASCSSPAYACCFCRPWSDWEKPYCVCEIADGGNGGGGGGGAGGDDGDGCTNDGSGCAAGCMSCRPDV